MPDMTDMAGEPAGPRQEAGDTIEAGETIAERAAELATEVTEARQPEERRRLTAAFAAAARSGARATGRGARAVQRGTIASSGWLTGQVVEMAPRVRVRNQARLRAQFPGLSIEDAADALITGASRASATIGAGVGAWFIAETGLWLAAVAWLADRGVRWLRRPTVQRWLERITGIVLIGFGLRLATESRRFA